jgi:chlorite dismutase
MSEQSAVAAPETQAQTAKPEEKKVKQQVVRFAFFKVMAEWRRLPPGERDAHKREFLKVIEKWNVVGKQRNITYSTVGLRGDVDMVIWTICYSVDELNQMMAELMATPLGGYMTIPHSFLSMTKRSQYSLGLEDEAEQESRSTIRPGGQKYIFIYPFWKTRAWFLLPADERKRIMDEHIRVGLQWPRVKLNTTYSFGLDDQEFVVAFECNYPEDFLDLVQRLRETESSAYTLKDTPMFTCIRMTPAEMLDRLG